MISNSLTGQSWGRGDNLETIELSLKIGGKFIIMEDALKPGIIGTSWITFDGRRLHLHHFGIDPEYLGDYRIYIIRKLDAIER
ncbi:MAG: hypothetical protein ABFR36_01375 [Acidobacteriota bacterium]